MDIRQWLEATADREPPDHSDDINIPESFRNDRPDPDQVVRGYRYKRKRATSDSSVIAPTHNLRRNVQTPPRASSPNRVLHAEDTARGSRKKTRSIAPSSSRVNAPQTTYERRARHKTRPDRYEHKVKKQKRPRDARKGKESDRKRRKSNRIDDGGRTAGLVQSFQLKNGPKNNRLTLKPDKSAGLFKHGRASVQMVGRGGGLPDLTFNELRFLQKPTEHQDDLQGADESHRSRTKHRKPNRGEEISAYFNAETAIATERVETRNDQQKESRKDENLATRSTRLEEEDHIRPVVELPDRPFLGFGSKGARPLSHGSKNESNSYYTWSETGQRPSSPPLKRQSGTHPDKTEANQRSHQHNSLGPSRAKAVEVQHALRPIKDVGNGAWIQTGRGRGQAVVEVYEPPHPRKPERKDSTPAIQTTSQSLPGHPSSPPYVRQRTVMDGLAAGGAREQRSYHTSDILKVHGVLMEAGHTSPRSHLLNLQVDQDKENRDPESSFSIDKAIRQARAAAQTRHSILQPPRQTTDLTIADLPNIRRMPSINDLPRIREVGNGHQPQLSGSVPLQPSYLSSFQPQMHSPLHHRPLSKAERRQWDTTATETLASRTLRTNHARASIYVDEDEEMLDNGANLEPAGMPYNNSYVDSPYGGSGSHTRRFTPRSSIFEAQLNTPDQRPSIAAFSEQEILEAGPVRGLSVLNELHSERSVHQANPIDEGLEGFWRPNILY